jgi:1-acyl-sn-glycerol-3-phosphate acyltransferase
MRIPLTAWTLARIVLHILAGIVREVMFRLRYGPQWYLRPGGRNAIQAWMQGVLRILRIKVKVHGRLPKETVLLVSNHITWLDIIVLSSTYPYSFLSKSEVRRWPLIGALSAMSGTLFIRRDDVRSLKTSIHTIRDRLRQGRSVSMFPEGTTRAEGLGPFKTGLFAAAIEAQVNVQPVVIRYLRNGKPDRSAAYIDDDNFMINLAQQAGKKGLVVELYFLDSITPNCDRRELAQHAHMAIDECQRKISGQGQSDSYHRFLEQTASKKIA